jgi:GNAT superfamily N-acetyltransferase
VARLIRRRRGRAARCPILEKWTRDTQQRHGLQRFEIEDLPNGDLIVPILVVPPDKRNQGIGTAVMTDLVELADQNSRRVWLTPSKKSMAIGTTSRDRLVRFYKGFGFVENTGKHRDFSQRHTMYRDPGGAAGGGNASYGSGHGFSVVGLPSMASEAAVRRALHNAGVDDVYSEVTRNDDEVSVVIKDARGNIQGMAAAQRVFFEHGDKDLCVRALAGLKLSEPRITNMWVVRGTMLKRVLRGRGVGAILYRVMVDAASEAGGALVPDSCFKGGATTKAALATWHRMRGPAWGPFRWNPALLPGEPAGRASRDPAGTDDWFTHVVDDFDYGRSETTIAHWQHAHVATWNPSSPDGPDQSWCVGLQGYRAGEFVGVTRNVQAPDASTAVRTVIERECSMFGLSWPFLTGLRPSEDRCPDREWTVSTTKRPPTPGEQ